MRVVDIIVAKRDGARLEPVDLEMIVRGYASGTVPDYQMSAFLMAVRLKGMSFDETAVMTRVMVESGRTLDLSGIPGVKVDKHSTGGVGDKTTLVVVPVLAACGLKVAKMSGRGLAFTGGTLDKLESIPGPLKSRPDAGGFNTALSVERFVEQVRDIGAAIAGQTSDMVPADKKIYALRDVTATVDSIPLIASSVMSKKIACSADVILLDVKAGCGAFMCDLASARELAQTMIEIGRRFDRKVSALITDMSQPLGHAVGNALEVAEAIETLNGGGPDDLRELCVELSAEALRLAVGGDSGRRHRGSETPPTLVEARAPAEDALASGRALEMFRKIIAAQGGDPNVADDPSLLPQAQHRIEVPSESEGFVSAIDCAAIGRAASLLGAGRQRKEDRIDPAVGVVVLKKIGDRVGKHDPLAVIHANDLSAVPEASLAIREAYTLSECAASPRLIIEKAGTSTTAP